jgi:hypothetical protein
MIIFVNFLLELFFFFLGVCLTHSKEKTNSNLKSFCWSNSDSSKILVVDTLPNPNFKILSLVNLTAMVIFLKFYLSKILFYFFKGLVTKW